MCVYVTQNNSTFVTYFCDHVLLSSQHLHLEVAVSRVNHVCLIDHTGNTGVFVHDDLTYDGSSHNIFIKYDFLNLKSFLG